jgi:hypothetical protein
MPVMDPLRRQRLLTGGFVLAVVFVGALSMDIQKLGWRFLILCLLAGTLGGLGFLWTKNRFLQKWNQLAKPRRIILVVLGTTLFLLYVFASNRHKPDGEFHDVMACLSVLGLVTLWGLYRLFSRFVDALYAHLSRR